MVIRVQPLDARAVANFILDLADEEQGNISNLVLQKLVYFAHGRFLTTTGWPLVAGEFEAWQFGPVHPHVYNAFKHHGSTPIRCRAEIVNPVTSQRRPIPPITDPLVKEIIEDIYRSLRKRAPASLVAIAHAKNSPWDFIVERARRRESISTRIPNDVIRERFRFHKVAVSAEIEPEVPDENSPFA